MRTLSELAALADSEVEGFERPTRPHSTCGGAGVEVLGRYHNRTCECQFSKWEQGSGTEWDDSPGALLMTVWMLPLKITRTHISVRVERYCGRVGGFYEGMSKQPIRTEADAAHAILVALLRAYGVALPEEGPHEGPEEGNSNG